MKPIDKFLAERSVHLEHLTPQEIEDITILAFSGADPVEIRTDAEEHRRRLREAAKNRKVEQGRP